MYIVIEGQDATGKDTQVEQLAKYLRNKGLRVVTYSESGTASSDPFVTEIAQLNYGSRQNISHKTRVLLYLVNRLEQWQKLAEPALKKNEVVITSRNWLSTLAYEGYGANVSKTMIKGIHKLVMPKKYFKPDKIVILTLTQKEREERLRTQANNISSVDYCSGQTFKRGDEVWKRQPNSFQDVVNKAYYSISEQYNIPTVSASGNIKEVRDRLLKLLELQ